MIDPMLMRDIIPETVTNSRTSEARVFEQKDFRDLLFARIRGQLETIETKLSWPYRSNPSETTVQQLAFLYELLDGVMANEDVAPDEVFHRKRKEQAEKGEYRLRLALVSKDMVKK